MKKVRFTEGFQPRSITIENKSFHIVSVESDGKKFVAEGKYDNCDTLLSGLSDRDIIKADDLVKCSIQEHVIDINYGDLIKD